MQNIMWFRIRRILLDAPLLGKTVALSGCFMPEALLLTNTAMLGAIIPLYFVLAFCENRRYADLCYPV